MKKNLVCKFTDLHDQLNVLYSVFLGRTVSFWCWSTLFRFYNISMQQRM